MSRTADSEFDHLPAAARRLGAALSRPGSVAAVCVVLLTSLGWVYLALQYAASRDSSGWFASLCQPAFGIAGPNGVASGLLLLSTMWAAMTLAMMLPSAAPMIMTYAGIAETAARKKERVVSPLVIAAGYVSVWLGFAVVAAVVQLLLIRLALLDQEMASASVLLSGAIFIGAGLYQFSSLKHACLYACRSPFPFFLANWQTSARGVFRLGVQQGLHCLGCCWAMMLVMFAVGTMNIVWMAALGAVMALEKITTGHRLSTAVGIGLLAAGCGFVIASIAGHWPV